MSSYLLACWLSYVLFWETSVLFNKSHGYGPSIKKKWKVGISEHNLHVFCSSCFSLCFIYLVHIWTICMCRFIVCVDTLNFLYIFSVQNLIVFATWPAAATPTTESSVVRSVQLTASTWHCWIQLCLTLKQPNYTQKCLICCCICLHKAYNSNSSHSWQLSMLWQHCHLARLLSNFIFKC